MRGKATFLALVAVFSVLSATAIAGGHRVVSGTKGGDELNAGGGADRVFARAGDDTVNGGRGNDSVRGGGGDDALFGGRGKDRLRGGQDNDLLDGGNGSDYLNGGGDGRDKDRIVCGAGYDVAVLGRGDAILVEVRASGDYERPEAGEHDCEEIKRPGGGREACAAESDGCQTPEPCAARDGGDCEEPEPCAASDGMECEPSDDEHCVATYPDCDDPVWNEPEPDPADEEHEPDAPDNP
jgi:RTX calcium-binding nonapeptide repeat (4 copies)